MSEQPGHPVPEGGRPGGDRPAAGPPATVREAVPGAAASGSGRDDRDDLPGEVGTPGRPELPTRSERPKPQDRPERPERSDEEREPSGRPGLFGRPGSSGPRSGAQQSWRALWLGGLALLTAFFFYPLGLVLGIAAVVVGVRAHRAARRERTPAPGAVPGIVLGAIGLAFSTFSVALTAFLWTELSGYQECVGAANTGIDRQTCQDEWFPKIEDKLGLPEGSMDQYGDLL